MGHVVAGTEHRSSDAGRSTKDDFNIVMKVSPSATHTSRRATRRSCLPCASTTLLTTRDGRAALARDTSHTRNPSCDRTKLIAVLTVIIPDSSINLVIGRRS
jgi:hypothetical protein